ncbi:MAG: Dicer-like protein 1 [Candelina mexicana]|nr:MAG: Dicer-like protein 1 [Candelina mexicana]
MVIKLIFKPSERFGSPRLRAVTHRGQGVMRRFCESLPDDRLLHGNDYDLEGQLAKEKSLQSYTEPETGAKLTYGSSLVVLAHFVGCLPHDNETTLQVTFVMSVQDKEFICEVILPENSPIRSAIGRPATKKSIAKRAAAFSACILLRKSKHLDGNLLPTYTKQLPAMRNALLALNMKKTNEYGMRIKPDLWESSWGSVPDELFITVLELDKPQALRRPYQPLAVLTRTRLPKIPEFLLYPSTDSTSAVICTSLTTAMKVPPTKLAMLNDFTLRFFSDLFNKVYESETRKMSYWLAPVDPASRISSTVPHPETLIDWGTVELAMEEKIDWSIDAPDSFYTDKFVVDPWSGARRWFSVGVAPEFKPLDPVPPGTVTAKYMRNILDYSNYMYPKARKAAKLKEDQPVFLAHFVHHRLNLLDEITDKEKHDSLRKNCYLCPEVLRFSTLPTGVAAMGLVFPAIISRIESYLIALDACKLLQITVEPALALEAITKDSDNTDEHGSEQINFRRGMGNNYERLEFIGDCFLKMATSISLFAQNPDNDEFEYHVKRMLLICNKNLFNTAMQLNLPEYIRTQSFARRTWYPEGLTLLRGKEKGAKPPMHPLGDKTVADVCEALIGAALVSQTHREGPAMKFDHAVKAVTALVRNPDHEMTTWSDYYKVYNKPTYQTSPATASQADLASKIESKLGYHFQYPRLLRSAFIHPSYPFSWEKVPCYQRLEFLGDALLDMACINYLFYKFPKKDPQWLTEHKMAMVSNKFLGAVCVKLGFHKHLRYNGALVEYQIRDYVTELQEAEAEAGGSRDYWTQVKNPPKCLPDVVEAYVGAVFVDSEFDYDEVESFFKKHIEWFFEDMTIYDTFANNHPTTFLHNLLTITFGCQNYRLLAQEMPSIDGSPTQVIAALMIHNEVIGEGRAASGKNAKVKASSSALEKLKGLAPYEYRMQYHCDCSTKAHDANVAKMDMADLAESAI